MDWFWRADIQVLTQPAKHCPKLMQMEPFLKAPACEQLGFVVMAAYVRDARPLGYTFCLGLHWSDLTLVYSLNHFVQMLLVAKACKLLGGPTDCLSLPEALVAFFRQTGGVGNRRCLLPRKVVKQPKRQIKRAKAGDAFNQVSIASSFTHVVDTIIALWLVSDSCR